MWSTLFTPLLVVVFVATCAALISDITAGIGNTTDDDAIDSEEARRLAANAFSLSLLDSKLKVLREKIRKASEVDRGRIYREIQARLIPLEGRLCEESEFECGHRNGECIFELFVCDGRKDCSNGYDEDAAVCSIEPALAGRTYSGNIHWTSCDRRDDHPVNITILGYRIRKYSSSIIWLKGLIEASYKKDGKQESTSHTAIGHYKFARRQIVLLGEGIGKENAAYCNFDKGDNKRTKCDLVKVSSLDHCATMHLELLELPPTILS